MHARGVAYKIIAVSAFSLILSGCTIGPLTLPDLPNPFAQKSRSGPEISTSATPTGTAEFSKEAIDVASDQPSRSIDLPSAQKIAFINTGKSDVVLTITLDRPIPVTISAGGTFTFNFTQPQFKASWKNTVLTFVNTGPTPTPQITQPTAD